MYLVVAGPVVLAVLKIAPKLVIYPAVLEKKLPVGFEAGFHVMPVIRPARLVSVSAD